ncbi:MAG: hypothetical protein Q9184_001193 [Pyrenodesmia sp. 2 TL-2023]
MHKIALTTLDKLRQNGLFEGRSLGNMLGTAFFYDTKLGYTMQDSPSDPMVKDYVRKWLVDTLRLVSAFTTIKRENILSRPTVKEDEGEVKRFEINTDGHGFLVVEGKESAVLQFFRHYGYQLYATLAMYTHRFTRDRQQTTSQARLAQKFASKDEERFAYLQDDNVTTVQGRLTRIYVRNHSEGQKVIHEYKGRIPNKATRDGKFEPAPWKIGDPSVESPDMSTSKASASGDSEPKED